MTQLIVIPPRGGEIVGDSPDRRVEILSDDDSLNATISRFGPRREGADLHVHRHHTDCFYVLEGEVTVRLGAEGGEVIVPAGMLARVPPLVVHGFRNGSDAEVRYLNFHAPGQRFADYLRAMRDGRDFSYDQHEPPADGGRSPSEAVLNGGTGVLADIDELGIAEVRVQPGDPSPPAHVHRRHVESFYVLEGAVMFTAGGHELHAETGSWVQIPRGVPHTLAVGGSEPARLLNLHTPSFGVGSLDEQPA